MFLLYCVLILIVLVLLFFYQPSFGALPKGDLLKQIQSSRNYKEGKFQNLHHTPDLAEGVGYYKVTKEFFFDKEKDNIPPKPLPSQKENLFALGAEENCLVWFGHSSYFMQIDGKKILVDPVLSGSASPVSVTTKAFPGSDVYTVKDIPQVDYLFISHDHWDHLDHKTVAKLQPTVGKVFCGLGVSAHLKRWGYTDAQIVEADWDEQLFNDRGFVVNSVPARHFSGRSLKRNQSLWMSYVLQTPSMKIFIGGDSGYDDHFKKIGEDFGPFDWVILECGQYHAYWKYIHMMPEEVVIAAKDLNGAKLLPVHWAKFSLALHSWRDPAVRVVAAAEQASLPIFHPMIGEKLSLSEPAASVRWWENE